MIDRKTIAERIATQRPLHWSVGRQLLLEIGRLEVALEHALGLANVAGAPASVIVSAVEPEPDAGQDAVAGAPSGTDSEKEEGSS